MLQAGKKLGPYEIVALLGAGGMGEVYRARDPRLGREVAIKVLPPVFSADAERLRRFEQEWKAAGALNHPNILATYDVGTDGGAPYLVTEFLVGETLRARLLHGPLPVRKALDCAVQIAGGLAAAHEKGIIHRDLKPENIFVCKDGRVKLLDFGLAKLTRSESLAPSLSVAPTAGAATEPGIILGTVGYMSPEQVRGLVADARSDLFNFGAVLYEMLSGQRAFRGATMADTLSAILKEEPPDLGTLRPELPEPLARLVHRCLEKDPDQRFQSAKDLTFSLESLQTTSDIRASSSLSAVAEKLPGRAAASLPLRLSIWVLGALLVVNAGLAAWWLRVRAAGQHSRESVQFQRLTDFAGLEEYPAISPDGKSLAFTADLSGTRQIWIRLMAGGAPLQLTHDAGEHLFPRWVRDSASLLYYTPPGEGEAQGTIWEISALGGSPRRLVSSLSGADPSHDGNKLAFFQLNNGQVQLVVSDRDGSNTHVLFHSIPESGYVHPRWSPDDRWIAFEHGIAVWVDDIYIVAATGGDPRRVTHEDMLISGFTWQPDGSGIVYSSGRGNTVLYLPTMHLWSARLDGGAPRQLTYADVGDVDPDMAAGWRILTSHLRTHFDLWKFPVSGAPQQNVRNAIQITRQTGHVQTPSPDPVDKEIAFLSDSGGHGNVWVKNLATGEVRQITFERDPHVTLGVPLWSPDGANIAFASTRTLGTWGDVGYWLVHPDGSNLRNLISEGSWATWTSDSRWMYYAANSAKHSADESQILKISVGGGSPIPVRKDQAISPAVAPDGSALYFVVALRQVNGTLDYEIRFARPEDGPSKLLARISGSRVPLWQGLHPVISHDGKWLALPLNDNFGTNIWLLSTADGELRRVTDFGQLRTFIARRVSWSSDDRFIYAAVGEGDADIVLLEGLLP